MLRSIQILHDDIIECGNDVIFYDVRRETVYYYDDVYKDIPDLIDDVDRRTRKKWKIEHYDIPVTFDIETSSFYDQGEKRACMYIWMFSIDDKIIIGRSWDEFIYLCDELVKKFSLHWKYRRMIVYVHHLGFEFQWFCKLFKWHKVFALDTRIPLSALTESGIEFRCSYRLSGYNLAKTGENLTKYKVEKMVGDLDYDKLRLPSDPKHNFAGTPLTEIELGYCINDVRVVSAYIRERIESDDGITHIPLTKTGYVRKYCREHIYNNPDSKGYKEYRDLMLKLTIEPDEYTLLKEGFQGGFVHGNAFQVGKTLHDGMSIDYCSKYPSMIVANMFPMGKGEPVTIGDIQDPENLEDFNTRLSDYFCVFRVKFTGIRSKILFENYISVSKCRNVKGVKLNNGRVISADYLETTITNLDYEIIKDCYEIDLVEIGDFYQYKKGYLPTPFIKCVLEFYRIKTELKDIEGKEAEYLNGKENLNSCYGMMVTSIVRDLVTYSQDIVESDPVGWTSNTPILQEEIDKYNRSKGRFLFYPWGVFVTAWSRYDLWKSGILQIRDDYVYSDTDSLKFINPEEHLYVIDDFNKQIGTKLLKAMRFHKLSPELITPKTVKGEPKPLGVFEIDGRYKRFKVMGAKRYLVDDVKKGLQLTVAGLPKKFGLKYLKKYKDPFKMFHNNMNVPAGESGKQTATYIDYETQGATTDYLGNKGSYHEMSSLHLEATGYDMDLHDYANYILGLGEVDEI